MTVKEENNLAREAAEMILKGTDVSEVETYVDEQVGGNPYFFIDVWQKAMWLLEYAPEMEWSEKDED